METLNGTFKVEDVFSLTNRGLVVVGQLLNGQVSTGNLLVCGSAHWRISEINAVNRRNNFSTLGLTVAAPEAARQELLNSAIIGATVLIFA